ncbi:MAG: hypothetical protein U9Q94_02565 [Candidatus Bipolaricaulota bacterium]|nr:hypothetical protein [Candidatus Bipolaricaulota bacterium]
MMLPRLIGLLVGLSIGILLVVVGWRVVLILLAFAVGGYIIVGLSLEQGSALAVRLRKPYVRLSRP